MVISNSSALLNDLLVALHRSLVQFATEVSPWASDADAALIAEVKDLAARQQEDVGRLVTLLNNREEAIDFGHYPHAFTSLHFVAVSFLSRRLLAEQRELVRRLESAVDELADDPEAQQLVQGIAASQREGLVRLLSVIPQQSGSN
jgi:hypothetical protein